MHRQQDALLLYCSTETEPQCLNTAIASYNNYAHHVSVVLAACNPHSVDNRLTQAHAVWFSAEQLCPEQLAAFLVTNPGPAAAGIEWAFRVCGQELMEQPNPTPYNISGDDKAAIDVSTVAGCLQHEHGCYTAVTLLAE